MLFRITEAGLPLWHTSLPLEEILRTHAGTSKIEDHYKLGNQVSSIDSYRSAAADYSMNRRIATLYGCRTVLAHGVSTPCGIK